MSKLEKAIPSEKAHGDDVDFVGIHRTDTKRSKEFSYNIGDEMNILKTIHPK